ncbi:hypothetical protein BLOT_003295 [Blomia tropicalis]|nr:hypothetical protein BLOT_003295 [Blomia tropicalis]
MFWTNKLCGMWGTCLATIKCKVFTMCLHNILMTIEYNISVNVSGSMRIRLQRQVNGKKAA